MIILSNLIIKTEVLKFIFLKAQKLPRCCSLNKMPTVNRGKNTKKGNCPMLLLITTKKCEKLTRQTWSLSALKLIDRENVGRRFGKLGHQRGLFYKWRYKYQTRGKHGT